MKKEPLVTVVCLCYNHEKYVHASIQSVLDQNYSNVELIVVDDASTDNSVTVINQFISAHPGIKFFPLSKNLGNCKAFNQALKHVKGEYLIDLAADDILKVDRIRLGVEGFLKKPHDYGITYSDAEIINEKGEELGMFYKRKNNKIIPKPAEEDVFADLLKRYFICPPTIMAKKEVYDELGGYNEELAYEDFDFLLRASKKYKFFFTDKPLVKRRLVAGSLSTLQYKKGSKQLLSTYKILETFKSELVTNKEKQAWRKRVFYEGRKALELREWSLVKKYFQLYLK